MWLLFQGEESQCFCLLAGDNVKIIMCTYSLKEISPRSEIILQVMKFTLILINSPSRGPVCFKENVSSFIGKIESISK